MNDMFVQNKVQGDKQEPNLLERASVAIADSCGWLHPVDETIVAEFRKQYPVFGSRKEEDSSQ